MLFFITGWFASAPLAWPYIADGFDAGNPAMGVLKFLAIVFVAGAAAGALGLVVGAVAGRLWERLHRHGRPFSPSRTAAQTAPRAEARASGPARSSRAVPGALRYERDSVTLEDYLSLGDTRLTESADHAPAAAAFARTVNLSAHDGSTVAGVARVLTDGFFNAALADIVVRPEYRMRGVGRALMREAARAAPRGVLHITARAGTGPFFDHIGCDRGVSGFVLRDPS